MISRVKFCIMILFIVFIPFVYLDSEKSTLFVSGYIPSVPIYISHDDNFTDYGFAGLGTYDNPYIIENLNVTVYPATAIGIRDTTKHFIVRNSIFSGGYGGITLSNVTSGTAVIYNNTVTGTSLTGISLFKYTENVTVKDNIIESTGNIGIAITASSNGNHIINNTLKNHGTGIYVQFSHDNIISNNTINPTIKGIVLENARNYIYNNSITDLTSYGIQIIGSQSSSSVISGNRLTNIPDNPAIHASEVNLNEIHYLRFERNIFDNVYYAVATFACFDIMYVNNSVSNSVFGFSMDYCSNITIIGNTISNNLYGIGMNEYSIVWDPKYSYIGNNSFINVTQAINHDGLGLTIENNLFAHCQTYGVRTDDGASYHNNYFFNNSIGVKYGSFSGSNNYFIGNKIGIFDCAVSIIDSFFINHTGYALDSVTGLIYRSVFVDNNLGNPQQAQAQGDYDCKWYHDTLKIGNWWSDWDGEVPYVKGNIYDFYPLPYDRDGDGIPDYWEIANNLNKYVNDSFYDTDSDLLTNLEEFIYDTLPHDDDSDDDGLLDGEEVKTYLTDPRDSDSDNDNLDDGLEINTYHTDPLDEDSENDGMPDGWEVSNSLNPLVFDAYLDPDGDGLNNLDEYIHRTDPNNPDSDNDGYTDGDEVNVHGTDPTDRLSYPDITESFGFNYVIISITTLILVFIFRRIQKKVETERKE